MTKLLIVDADAAVSEANARTLEAAGFHVDQVRSIAEASESLTQQDYALVLADLQMPDACGIQTIALFKGIRPHLEVVIMSGQGTLDFAIEAIRAGATDLVLKPCTDAQLRAAVKKALSRRELSQANKMLIALNEMKDKFLTLVSHELRTPLTLIFGYLTLFQRQDTAMSKEQRDLMEIIMKSTRKLIQIVNNMQTVAQAEAGEMQLHLQPIEPRRLFSDVLAEVKASVLTRDLKMTLTDGDDAGPLYGDSIRLRQIIHELLQNAVRNTPDGGEISVGVYRKEGRVILWVKDTGIGIPLEEQSKIFEPFYEVADVEKHTSSDSDFRGGGIGLGLSLVKAVVEAHRGTVRVETAPNQGTLVEISLPSDLTPGALPQSKFASLVSCADPASQVPAA